MKFKKEDLINMIKENSSPLEMIERSEWQDDGKYSNQDIIFRFEGKDYFVDNSRCGSYFTYYEDQNQYWPDEVECPEMEQVEITKIEWRKKK